MENITERFQQTGGDVGVVELRAPPAHHEKIMSPRDDNTSQRSRLHSRLHTQQYHLHVIYVATFRKTTGRGFGTILRNLKFFL